MGNEITAQAIVSSSPHTHSGDTVRRIMLDVLIALVPAFAVSVYLFELDAVRLVAVCVLSCVVTEALCRRAMGRDLGIGDLSAAVTGVLLAFNLPPGLPSWMALAGSVVAIGVAKQVFGGIGYNPFNPALIGRAFMLLSFPAEMTHWSKAVWDAPDATTGATPLSLAKSLARDGTPLPFDFDFETMFDFFLGRMNGCIGEVSAAALILGGVYLLYRRCITWHVPVAFIGSVIVLTTLAWAVWPTRFMPPHFHLFTGGLMLGAWFMATDMVTTPITNRGLIVFGLGCGVLTVLIRLVPSGAYPEGVSFAILLMNALTPLINRATRPAIFGRPTRKPK